MRLETKNLQTRVDDLAASDERTASTITALISWIETVSRAVETQREENHRSVDRTADIFNGELESLRKELTAVVDKLRGDKDPETVGEIEIPPPKKSKKPAPAADFEMVEESKVLNFSAAGE